MNLNNLPCISDADPGEHDRDDDEYVLLEEIRTAILLLQCAEEEMLRRHPDMDDVDAYITDALSALGFPALPSPK